MALLIASELLTLLFAMQILSAVRSFVGGEGLWSKAQKNAVHSLHRYASTGDYGFYQEFLTHLEMPLGDRAARLELEKPVYDMEKVTAGFVQGGIHRDDVPGLVRLIRGFYWVHYIENALNIWRAADDQLAQLIEKAAQLDASIRSRSATAEDVTRALAEVDRLNDTLTALEIEFSEILGAGSRWLERILMMILIFAVLTVETTGLALTVIFSRNLNRSLKELSVTAEGVGRGNFDLRVPVRSKDELGQLAEAINKMSADLKRAESASQVKSQFLANMSHEIRTPLNVILGLTEILKDSALSWPDHKRYVETIERTGQNLMRIINDILDISKVEAGHLEIQSAKFPLNEFLIEIQSMLSVQADRTGNELKFEGRGDLPTTIITDRTRLRQILVNLINNSLKFTRDGRVSVTYWRQGADLNFDVTDTGRGIANEDRERIFRSFTRVEESIEEGTGLGLMLSKKLARALGGDVILLNTQEGIGSTFRLSVKVELPEQGTGLNPALPALTVLPTSAGVHALNGRRALVVEDSEDNQLLVKLFLSRQGISSVDFASNGRDGVEAAMKNDYDFVLMDMQMPIMDGYQATKTLRAQGYEKPIIALTAHAMKEDRERCLRAGCSDYLTKPLESKALHATLARYLSI